MATLDPQAAALLRPIRTIGVKLDRESQLPGAVALTPEEAQQNAAYETSPAVRAEFEQAIAGEQDPAKQAVLQQAYQQDFGASQVNPKRDAAAARPPTWDEVLKLPEMQKLSGDQLESARNAYFVDVVAPLVPTDQLDAARAAFDADTRPGPIQATLQKAKSLIDTIRRGITPQPGPAIEPTPEELARAGQPARITRTRRGQFVFEDMPAPPSTADLPPDWREQMAAYEDNPEEIPQPRWYQLAKEITRPTLLGELGKAASDLTTHVKAAISATKEGLEPDFHNDWINASRELIKQRAKEGNDDTTLFPGLKVSDVRQLSPSFAFSVVSMLSGMAGAGGATLATGGRGGPGAAYAGGALGSYVAAYRQAGNQFLRDVRDSLDEQSQKVNGRPLTDAEWKVKQDQFTSLAREYGLWEAVPEAVGNVAGAKIILTASKVFGDSIIARAVKKLAALYGTETGTEGITQQGQHNVEVKAGITEGPERSFTSASDLAQSFKEVAPVTVLQTTLMAGAAGGAARIARGGVKPEAEQPQAAQQPRQEQGPIRAEDILGTPDTGEQAPAAESPVAAAPAQETPRERLATVNRLLSEVAASKDRDTLAGHTRTQELIAERAKLEAEINPEVDQGKLQRQNRDRSRAALVGQMQSIANAPDYDRLGPAPIPDVGAPMVSIAQNTKAIPETDYGNKGVATLADGTKVPVRYAVVEANSVMASHDVSGRENKDYFEAPKAGELRALTNGRVAGLAEAYRRNTAGDYAKRLAEDADALGIAPDAVTGKKQPMLVRVYDDAYNQIPRLAQLSNTGGSAKLSPVEQAQSDATLIDSLDDFKPGESGEIDTAGNKRFVQRFIARVPEGERGELIDAKGRRLTQLGATRVRNAILAKAYGAGDVLMRMVESTDNNVRNITAGLMRAADKVAKLREDVRAGALHDLDITEDVVGAVESYSRLRSEGKPVSTWLAQSNIFGDAVPQEAVELMQFLDANSRSGKRVAQFLENYLGNVRALGSPAQGSMFEKKLPSRADLIREAQKGLSDDTGASEEGLSGRAAGAEQAVAEGAAPAAAGSAAAVSAPGLTVQGPGSANAIDEAAHEAATSPANELSQPTEGQKEAGDYQKGHFVVSGLDTSIENPAGSVREGETRHGDQVDVFWKAGTPEDWNGTMYVVNQNNRAGQFDEHKVMGGYDSLEEARAAYIENYTPGWESRIRSITAMPMDDFKSWVYDKSENGPKGGEAISLDPLDQGVADALADLGAWVDRNLVPKAAMLDDNAEQNLLPILTRLFDAAIKKGARDFKTAARAVIALVRKQAQHLAEKLNEDILRRAYTAAGGKESADASSLRSDAGQVHRAGNEQESGEEQGRANLQRETQAGPGAGNALVGPGEEGRQAVGENPIPRSEVPLTAEQEKVETRFRDWVWQNLDHAVEEYRRRFGNTINTDDARELSPDYAASKEARSRMAPAVHEPASYLAKEIYRRMLAESTPQGQEDIVLFTAGGTGAGKTSGIRDIAELNAIKERAHIVYDTNMNTEPSASKKIDQALEAGKAVSVLFSYREPHDAFVNGVLPRAMKRGRTVVAKVHIDTHRGAIETLPRLVERYRGNNRVDFQVIDNSMGKGQSRVISLEELAQKPYNISEEKLHETLQSEHQAGRISEAVYHAVRGAEAKPAIGRSAEEAQSRAGGNRGEELESQRGARQSRSEVENARRLGQQQLPLAEPAGRSEAGNRALGGEEPGAARVADRGQVGGRVAEEGQANGGERNADREAEGAGEARSPNNQRRPSERPERGRAGQRDTGESRDRAAALEPSNYVITESDDLGGGGLKTKAKQNLAAIRLVKSLAAESRRATPDEQAALVKYVGWGGLKGVFDERNDEWAKERAELKDALTPEEYDAARRSVLDAHFTSETVVNGIYDALKRFGFDGGRTLEPAAGSGNFLGLAPADLRGKLQFTAVELDPITGAIAKQLYQQADVVAPRGFQEIAIPEGYFDAAIGNPPFGSQSIVDKANPELSKFSIHNFFFAKSVKSLRPGGVLGMVVSNFFMDARNRDARTWIAQRAELVGAVRLPNTAFQKNANTEVTTDIVFLKKRAQPITKAEAAKEPWVSTGQVKDEASGEPIPLNQYFIAHPDMMLGKMTLEGTMYSKGNATLTPNAGEDLGEALRAAIAKLPEGVYEPAQREIEAPSAETVVPEHVKVGGLFVTADGKIARRTPDVLDKPRFEPYEAPNERAIERIKGMVRVRDALRTLMRSELDDEAESTIQRRRTALNTAYDAFVRKQGYINSLANRRAFELDPDLPLLEALERDYDPGLSRDVAKKEGVAPREPSAKKASIFRQRVLSPHASVKSVESAGDALSASLNMRGRVDLDYMAQVYGRSPEQIARELVGVIYEDPREGWVTSDAYLSGNVKAKLAQAKAAAAKDQRFAANVAALERVQPADVGPEAISVKLGSSWVPANHISDFIHSLLDVRPAAISYQRSLAQWILDLPHRDTTAFNDTWGAKTDEDASWGAERIIAAVLNNKPIVVRKNIGTSHEPQYITLERETDAALAKADAIAQKFRDWVWEDQARREELTRIYNDQFNTDQLRKYDGSHLTLPGTNPTITLTPHKRHSVWRIIQNQNTLLDHVVGSGKTFTIAAAFMEMRRLGLVRKPMVTVPNHIVRQWRDEWYALYPNANILATTEKDFEKGNRQRLFARIATGDWDAVIVAHSSFGKIGMPAAEMRAIMQEQVDDITSAIDELKKTNGDRFTIRQMEQARERIKAKLEKAEQRTGTKDLTLNFAELGVDALAVDEAHEFKNLFYYTQMRNVSGLGDPEGSGKAFDLFVKTRYLQQRGGRIVDASGTPISNSLVEMFTLQRYLDYDGLKARGIAHLDAWAGLYADIKRVWETHPSGNGYRMATRFAKFVNLPELITQYRKFADVVTQQDMFEQAAKEGKRYPIPRIEGGKPKLHVAGRSPEQVRFFGVPQFVRDADGKIQFKRAMDDGDVMVRADWVKVFSMGEAKDEARWPKEREPFAIVGRSQQPEGFFATREQAQAALDAERNTPLTQYNEGSILWKYENLRELTRETNGKVNALSITNEARKAGLDYRMIHPEAPDFSHSKVNQAVAEIVRIHDQWKGDRGTQLIFIDLSTPKGAKAAVSEQTTDAETGEVVLDMDALEASKSAFSVYDDVKAKLIAAGIPAREIAFIHDAHTAEQKKKLFAKVNRGEVRILIGSTPKMGAGTNVQKILVAEHHMDAPWRPSDLEQREGRILRQGNSLYERDPDGFRVEIHRYATEKTYDTRMWQIIEHKAVGIEQLRRGQLEGREMEDISSEAANSAEMKAAASGNPLIAEEIQLRDKLKKLENIYQSFKSGRYQLEGHIARLEQAPKRAAEQRANIEALIKARKPKAEDGIEFTTADGQRVTESKGLLEPAAQAFKKVEQERRSVALGTYRGFNLWVHRGEFAGSWLILGSPGTNSKEAAAVTTYWPDDKFSPSGFVQRLDHYLDNFESRIAQIDTEERRAVDELKKAKAEVAKPFEQMQELEDTRKRHREVAIELQRQGGAIELTPEMQAELEEARKARGKDTALSRNATVGGMTREDANAVANLFREKLQGLPPVHVAQSIAEAPPALRADIREMGGQNDTAGAWHKGEIWLFADHLRSPEHGAWVILHESTHHGLRGMLGADLDRALMAIYMNNNRVREQARVLERDQKLSAVRATEEVLANMGGDNLPRSVWERLISFVRRTLRRLGLKLELTDADIRDLVARALYFVKNKPKRTRIMTGTALNASLSQSGISDEKPGIGGRALRPGEAFIVYRVGDEAALDNRNGGNAESVAHHIASFDDFEAPAGPAIGEYVAAFEVKVPGGFGAYQGLRGGEGAGNKVGRVVRNGEVAYSFPKEAKFDARLIGRVPLADVRRYLELRGNAYGSFDEAGVREGAAAIRALVGPQTALSRGVGGTAEIPARTGTLDTLVRVPTQLLGIDKLTGWIYDRLLEKVGAFIPEKAKAGLVADYGIPEAVVDRRDRMFGRMRRALRQTEGVLTRLTTLTRAESRIAYDWMTSNNPTTDALLEQLPEESRGLLRELKDLIDAMGKEAVRLKQLSPEAYERNKLAYLHRSYRKFEVGLSEQERTTRARAIRILGDQYKGRGMVQDASMERVKNAAPEWWRRKLKAGQADKGLKGEAFIRFERRTQRGAGVGTLPGVEEAQNRGRLLEVEYWPASEPVPQKYATWERDAAPWEARDVKGGKLVLWRDFTRDEQQQMGLIDEVRFSVAKTMHGMIHDIEVGRYLEWLANTQAKPEAPRGAKIVEPNESMMTAFAPDTWVQVPTSQIPGTDVSRYGKLGGLYVPGPIWNDIRQVVRSNYQPLGEYYGKLLRAWKASKTALSPTVHLNNVMANVVMADWHDVLASHVTKALSALVRSNKDPVAKQLVETFEDMGGMQGSFSISELQREQLRPMLEALEREVNTASEEHGMAGALAALQLVMRGRLREAWDAAGRGKTAAVTKAVAGKMIDLYQFEDTVFRLAAFIKAKEEGATDEQAGKVARKSFLDYHINAPWIQMMRASAFPFIAFTYRAAPMLLETAARKPWKLLKLGLVVGAANAIGYMLSGGDEDRERKLLPEEKAGSIFGLPGVPKLVRMPWNDAHGSPVFLDIRRWIPVGDIFDLGQTHSVFPILPVAIPGGPLAIIAELLFNKSQFTGKEITKGTDTPLEVAQKVFDHLYKAFAPNIVALPGTYAFQSVYDAGKGRTDPFGRERSLPMAAASSVGVKLGAYPADVAKRGIKLDYEQKRREIGENISALRRELMMKGISREEFDRRLAAQVAKLKTIQEETRERLR